MFAFSSAKKMHLVRGLLFCLLCVLQAKSDTWYIFPLKMDIDCIGLYFSVLWKDGVGKTAQTQTDDYISGSLPGWGKCLLNEKEQT